MSIKTFAAKIYAKKAVKKIQKWSSNPVETQERVFEQLLSKAKNTSFGKDHDFKNIKTPADFAAQVPIGDYEDLRPYVDRAVKGEEDVLWPGKPMYLAKTSGTTSGVKYIPLTKDSLPSLLNAARNAMLCYIHQTGKTQFIEGKLIFLQGSPELTEKHGIKIGRLSGIVAHHVPKYLQRNRLPSWKTNCIEDWETKVDEIVKETKDEDMTLISGIPPWVQMYFERLETATNRKIGDLFKNFHLFIYGGVNYEPYRLKFEALIGRKVDSIELYPASEGFFAYQDDQNDNGMLLRLDAGIFYEFVDAKEFFDENAKRITIADVQEGINYVMIISTNAGLWAYNLGDTVKFTSTKPYRLVVSGRIKHFISAFGEHVIGKEVEEAMEEAVSIHQFSISEFTVAPQIISEDGELPYHEWLIEFEKEPSNLNEIANSIEKAMLNQNSYYNDLIQGKVLQPLKISSLKKDSFQRYMKSQGKLGGQNKVPRLSNNREIADAILKLQY